MARADHQLVPHRSSAATAVHISAPRGSGRGDAHTRNDLHTPSSACWAVQKWGESTRIVSLCNLRAGRLTPRGCLEQIVAPGDRSLCRSAGRLRPPRQRDGLLHHAPSGRGVPGSFPTARSARLTRNMEGDVYSWTAALPDTNNGLFTLRFNLLSLSCAARRPGARYSSTGFRR